MIATGKHANYTVRPTRPWWQHRVLYAVVFIGVAAAVYALRPATKPRPVVATDGNVVAPSGNNPNSHRAYAESQEALDRARQDVLKANARLDAFLEYELKPKLSENTSEGDSPIFAMRKSGQSPVRTKPVLPKPVVQRTPELITPIESQMVDNPQWLTLSEQLDRMIQHRQKLLIDRTPIHPEVEDSRNRISAMRQEMSFIPRKIPGEWPAEEIRKEQVVPAAETPEASEIKPTDETLAERAVAAEKYRRLKAEVEQTAKRYDQAVMAERQAWQESRQTPQPIHPQPNTPCEIAQGANTGTWRVPTALLAGLLVVTGVGMVVAGATIEPTLNSVGQVQAVAATPVVGTIPTIAPKTRRRPMLRAAVILGGMLLIAALVAVVCMG